MEMYPLSTSVALTVPDSLVAFFAVAFLSQLVVCILGAVQGFLTVSSDDHSPPTLYL